MKIIRFVLLAALSAVFAVAAITKIADPAAWVDAIQTYRVLPNFSAVALAAWLPWLELTAAVSLWHNSLRRAALGIIASATLIFIIALLQAWFRGIDVRCGCFGRGDLASEHGYLIYFARDAAILVTTFILSASPDSRNASVTRT